MRLLAALSSKAGIVGRSAGAQKVWKRDLMALKDLQCADGGWEIGWLCKYGNSGVELGNRGVCTAFAVKAIQGFQEEKDEAESKGRIALRRGSSSHWVPTIETAKGIMAGVNGLC